MASFSTQVITNAEDYKCQPIFWHPPVVRSPFCLSVSMGLAFQFCQTKDCYPSQAEGKLFGRLASVLWVLCACQCACLVALAIRDFAYCLPVMMQLLVLFVLQMCLTWCGGLLDRLVLLQQQKEELELK